MHSLPLSPENARCNMKLGPVPQRPLFSVVHLDNHRVFRWPDYKEETIEDHEPLETLEDVLNLKQHEDLGIHSIMFLKSAQGFITGGPQTDVRMHLWNQHKFTLRETRKHLGPPVTCLRYLNEELCWCLGCACDGTIFTFSPEKPGFEEVVKENQQTYTLDTAANGQNFVSGGNDGTLRVYDLTSHGCKNVYQFDHYLNSCARVDCPEQQRYIEWLQNKKITSFEEKTQKREEILTRGSYDFTRQHGDKTFFTKNYIDSHNMRVMAVKFEIGSWNVFASAGWDRRVNLWDIRAPKRHVLRFFGPFVCSSDAMDFKDQYILTGSWRYKNALEIFDLRYLKKDHSTEILSDRKSCPDCLRGYECPQSETVKIKTPNEIVEKKAVSEYVYACKFISNHTIVSAGVSGDVRFMSRAPYQCLLRVPLGTTINCMDIALEGNYVACGCKNGSVHVLKVYG